MPLIDARAFVVAVVSLLVPFGAYAEDRCASAYEQTQVLRHDGKLIEARDSARACSRSGCPDVARRDCASWAERLELEIPSVIVIARDEVTGDEGGARIFVDGVAHPEAGQGRAFELNPGAHVFHVERNGNEPTDLTITVLQGQRDRPLRFDLHRARAASVSAQPASAPGAAEHESPSAPSYVPAALVAGGSALAFAASAWLGLSGRSDLSRLRTSCAPACSDDEVDPMKRKLLFSDIALGAGVVGSAIAIYLFAHASASSASSGARVDVSPTPRGAALTLRAAF